MIYYIFPFFYTIFFSLILYISNKKYIKGWHIFILMLPAILVFVLRGNVGTDTYYYLALLDDYKYYGESAASFEPGFEFFGKTLTYLGFSPRIALAVISLITTIILCKAYAASKRQMLVFILLVFPLFFYDFTMNGIRYGLSFSLATLSVDSLYRKKYRTAFIWGLISFSIQYSSLFVILPFVFALVKKRYIIFFTMILVGLFVQNPELFSLITDRVAGKRDSYSEIFSSSVFSGLMPLIIVFLMYVGFLKFGEKKNSKLIHMILLLELLSFVLAKFTYAGLRFQGVFMYCMIIYLKNNIDYVEARHMNKIIYYLLFICLLGILILIKNISVNVDGDMSPFLPYKFFWEEKRLFTI